LTFLSSAGKNGRIRREISLLPVHFSVLSHWNLLQWWYFISDLNSSFDRPEQFRSVNVGAEDRRISWFSKDKMLICLGD
jgi:hypothetical protein